MQSWQKDIQEASKSCLVVQYSDFPVGILLNLDDMNERGRQIRHAFDQVCDGCIDEFIRRVNQRDAALVGTVNTLTLGKPELAVCWGGSEQHRDDLPTPVS